MSVLRFAFAGTASDDRVVPQTGGSLLIQFHADHSIQEAGFLFGWTVLPLPTDGVHCAVDCAFAQRGNGHCDDACMNAFCEFDRGDCDDTFEYGATLPIRPFARPSSPPCLICRFTRPPVYTSPCTGARQAARLTKLATEFANRAA